MLTLLGGFGGDGRNGANGGHGADINLVNPVSGSTNGRLELYLNAIGGGGGNALDTGAAGLAGNANAVLSAIQPPPALQSDSLYSSVTAQGGFGGNGNMQDGAAGGNAHAAINLTSSPDELMAQAQAVGGGGGFFLSSAGGNGGTASATVSAVNPVDGLRADLAATGGAGGDGAVRGGREARLIS